MKVLVTGASGQLGSRVCRMLMEAGVEIRAVDRVPGKHSDFAVEIVDLLDQEKCSPLFEGVDVLAHFANNVDWNSDSQQKVYDENVAMNTNVFRAAAESPCRRIVFSSTIQVFNGLLPLEDREAQEIRLPYLPIDSAMPAFPRNSYALSKEAGENMLKYLSNTKAMTCISIRYPWLLDSQLLKKAMEEGGIRRGKCFDGFAYLPVRSGAEVAVAAMNADLDGYRQYFVASKDNLEQRAARDVVEEQLSQVPLKTPIEELDTLVDCTIVEGETGWKQPQSLSESFEKYCKE